MSVAIGAMQAIEAEIAQESRRCANEGIDIRLAVRASRRNIALAPFEKRGIDAYSFPLQFRNQIP